MSGLFVIILGLILAPYCIGHKVFTVPLTKQYVKSMHGVDSAANLNSDPNNLELGDVSEEYVINSDVAIDALYYINMWYPLNEYYYEQRFILDQNSSRMTAPIKPCNGCLEDVSKIPVRYHD